VGNDVKEREKVEDARQQSLKKRLAAITTDENAGKSGRFTIDPLTGKRKPVLPAVAEQQKPKEA